MRKSRLVGIYLSTPIRFVLALICCALFVLII